MRSRLAMEFYYYLIILMVFVLNASVSGFLLFSKSPDSKSLRARFQKEPFCRGWGWLWFAGSIIICFIMLVVAVKAYSAWISYVPYWQW